MKKSILVILLIPAIFVFTSFSTIRNTESIESKITNILKWEEKFGFSGAVMVVKNGEIILNEGYGFANKNSWILNTPQTAFYVASVSKPITALAVMKLVERKKINLNDYITKYFSDVPENKKLITVEMLLTHTSGLEHTYSCDNISDRSEAIRTILNGTSEISAPGEKFHYSGDNYTLLAAIIEIVSGYKFETFVSENILKPAGIDKPAFAGDLKLLDYEDIASPYDNSNYKSLKEIERTWGRKGRSGMILSIEDLYKLDLALEENILFKEKITADILSPKIKNNTGSNYGYGFRIDKNSSGSKIFGHSGDDDAVGHNVEYLDFPDENVKIFIASNSDNMYSGTSWSAIISSMLQRFLFESNFTYPNDELYYNEFQKYSSEDLEKYEGIYKTGNTDYHVWINNDKQLIISPVGNEVAKTFGYSEAYVKKNILAVSILEETHDQRYSLLRNNCKDNVSFEKIKNTISSFWQSLEKKNGALEGIEILGTANIWSGNYQADIATWFKLIFKNKTQLFRMEWDGNNRIAGFGGGRIPYPMMFTMNAIAENEFIGFDPANGRTIAVNFLSHEKNIENKKLIEVNIENNVQLILKNSGSVIGLHMRSAAGQFYNTIKSKGISAANEEFSLIKENKLNRFDVDEGELNDFGYKLLNEEKFNEAIAILTILVKEFPESANGFDSLGEAFMKSGNKTEAVKNYEKSMELDPKNENAKKILKQLHK